MGGCSPAGMTLTVRVPAALRVQIAEWRQLAMVAAVVRYADDPQWLGVEWADGAPASVYVTPARDALAAALLDAAQASAGRPVPVLPAPTPPGAALGCRRVSGGTTAAVELDAETERMVAGHLGAGAARVCRPAVASVWSVLVTMPSAAAEATLPCSRPRSVGGGPWVSPAARFGRWKYPPGIFRRCRS